LLVVRGGERALDDDHVRRASELTRARWGFDGISVFEAPNADVLELCRRVQAVAERPKIRTAFARDLRRAGFALLDTGAELHWTIVLADLEPETFQRLRSAFGPVIQNPATRLVVVGPSMSVMVRVPYDVWYDPNEVDANGRVQVLLAWLRDGVSAVVGDEILAGDDELEPIRARVVAADAGTGIVTLQLRFGVAPSSSAVA
jgi:hypothetical protein